MNADSRLDKAPTDLVLASGSPRRRELLGALGITFRIEPSAVDEAFEEGEEPHEVAQKLAFKKAYEVSERFPNAAVLGADTVVAIQTENGSQLFGKPETTDDARRMLRELQGKTHRVVTGLALLGCGGVPAISQSVETKVEFSAMSDDEIDFYVNSGEPMDKAGAYAVQGIASMFIRRIEGSYSNVVGLPLVEVREALSSFGLWKISDVTLKSKG